METRLYLGIVSTVACLSRCNGAQPLPQLYTDMVAQFDIPSALWFPNLTGGVRLSRMTSDEVSAPVAYWMCVRRCTRRTACLGVSYNAVMKVCVLSFDEEAEEVEAPGFVLSRKSSWDTATYLWCNDCCDTGLKCQKSGACVKEECPVLENPENGTVLGNLWKSRKTIAYQCDRGFKLISGDAKRTCRGGNWNGTAATCDD